MMGYSEKCVQGKKMSMHREIKGVLGSIFSFVFICTSCEMKEWW